MANASLTLEMSASWSHYSTVMLCCRKVKERRWISLVMSVVQELYYILLNLEITAGVLGTPYVAVIFGDLL